MKQVKREDSGFPGISGNSDAIKRIEKLILKYSLEEEPLLLLGATGVGKNYFSELIHKLSGRKGRFVVVDTTILNENLFESELFGHKRGAFTGAVDNKKGLIEEAEEGTLFIDEISEIPVSLQAKLMRLIETKKYRVLGNEKEKVADIRIISASNRDLRECVKEKLFREDLFYRISVLEITIPPLRDRVADIKNIVQANKNFLKGNKIGVGFWDVLYKHTWPGNIRELLTVLKRAGILCESPISGKDLQKIIYDPNPNDSFRRCCQENRVWEELRAGESFWDSVKAPFLKRDLNRREVKGIIREGLRKVEGKYKNLLHIFNLKNEDYHRFMRFLHEQQLKPQAQVTACRNEIFHNYDLP